MDTVALSNPQISREQRLRNSTRTIMYDSDGIYHDVSNRLRDVECIKSITFAIDFCLQVASS